MANIPHLRSPHDDSALNIQNRTIDVVNQISQNMQDLVAEGQLTPSQYTQMMESLNGLIKKGELSVNDINKNLGKMDSTFFTEEFLEDLNKGNVNATKLLPASVTTDKVAPFAITPEKTTLFHDGGNLFNGHYEDGLLIYGDTHGLLNPSLNYNNYQGKTAVMSIRPNTEYVVSVDITESNVLRVGGHSSYHEFTPQSEYTPIDTTYFTSSIGNTIDSVRFTSSSTDRYLYVYVSNEAKEPVLTVYEDVDALTIKREFLPGPQNRSIAPEHTTFFSEAGENIFDGNYKDGLIVAYLNHTELQPRNNYGGWEGKTAEVSVKPNTNYQITVGSDANVLRVGSHPTPFTFLDETTPQEFLNTTLYSTSVGEHESVVNVRTGPNDHYLYAYVSNEGREPELSVIEGGLVIPAHFLEMPSDITTNKNPKFNLVGDFDKLYMKDEITDYVSNPRTIAPQSLQDMFIDVTNSNEGTSYDLLGKDDFGYNLYKYESKPLSYYEVETDAGNSGNDDGMPMKSPKVVISAGVHGRERSASLAAYYFYRELLENPTNNPVIEAIRTNVHIILVPIVCPSGFEDNTYGNRNGQNLNRDFPPHGDVSQKESQYLKEVLDEHSDMDYFIDFHNMFMRDDLIGYSLTDNDFFKYSTLNMYRAVGRGWQKEHAQMPQSFTHRWAYTAASNVGTVGRYVNDVLGVPSTLLELARESAWLKDGDHGESVSRMGVDFLVNLITACIRNEQ